jgi:hypothetical protein
MSDYSHLLAPRSASIVQDARFIRRVFAFTTDLLIINIAVAAPFAPVFANLLQRADQQPFGTVTFTTAELLAGALLFAIIYLYFVLFEYLLQQTPGMMLAHTRVQGKTTLLRMLIRNSFVIPVFPFLAFWLIEPVAILWQRRGVLEQLSGTRTVQQQIIII